MPCLAIGLYLVSIHPFWGGVYVKLPAHKNNVYRWYGLESETLVAWGFFGCGPCAKNRVRILWPSLPRLSQSAILVSA